jgi:hypothetical protein
MASIVLLSSLSNFSFDMQYCSPLNKALEKLAMLSTLTAVLQQDGLILHLSRLSA